jgi:hypothetical protein
MITITRASGKLFDIEMSFRTGIDTGFDEYRISRTVSIKLIEAHLQ